MFRLNRPAIVAGLAAALLSTVALPPALAQPAPPPMQAAPVSAPAGTMDINVFYDQLADYGTWVRHPDFNYVFIPSDVGTGWRPYQDGRWVWTDAYGWYWESYEPFGWATYHYGRWGYDPSYGWFWVPGDTWAPAWVTWRRGGGRTGWAPIAPDRAGFAVGRPVAYQPPVAESWVFVEDRYMGQQDLLPYIAPIPAITVYLRAAPDFYEPAWDDGYYVNRGFGLDVYDPSIRDQVARRQVVYVDRYDDVFYDDNRIGIFAPRVAFPDRAPPPPDLAQRIAPDRRPLIRQYVRGDDRIPGVSAPSAAVLGAIDPAQRRALRERRFEDPDAYRRDLDRIEQQRADRIRQIRREADARGDALERQRREAVQQRQQEAEQVRAQMRDRAQRVNARPDAPENRPGPPPGAPPPGQGRQPPAAATPQVPPGAPAQPGPAAADQRRQQIEQQRQQQLQQRQQQVEQQRQQADQQRQQQVQQRQQQIEQQRQQAEQRQQELQQRRQQVEQQRQQADQQRQQQVQQRQQQVEQQRQQAEQRQQEMQQRRQQADQQRQQQMEQRQQQVQQRQQQNEQRQQEMQQRRQQADQQRQQQMEQRRQQIQQQVEQRRAAPPQGGPGGPPQGGPGGPPPAGPGGPPPGGPGGPPPPPQP